MSVIVSVMMEEYLSVGGNWLHTVWPVFTGEKHALCRERFIFRHKEYTIDPWCPYECIFPLVTCLTGVRLSTIMKWITPSQTYMKNYFIAALLFGVAMPASLVHAMTSNSIKDANRQNVVEIVCGSPTAELNHIGSGVVIGGSTVLTSAWVVTQDDGVTYQDWCVAGVISGSDDETSLTFSLNPTGLARSDIYFNYAFMEAVDDTGSPVDLGDGIDAGNADSVLRDAPFVYLGFPADSSVLTAANGTIDGFVGSNWIRTDDDAADAFIGGGAFDRDGNLFGIIVNMLDAEAQYRTYILNFNAIAEDAFGVDLVERDYTTLHDAENIFCIDGHCYNHSSEEVEWTDLAEGGSSVSDDRETIEETDDATTERVDDPSDSADELEYTIPSHAAYDSVNANESLLTRLNGYILLQAEQHGEAWYVHPTEHVRYYLRDGAIAYQMMRSFGLGISDADLSGIPSVDAPSDILAQTSICSANTLANRLKGQILLQVEQHGEAWYVHPDTCYRVYLKDGTAAYDTMRYLSLGVTDADLSTLPYSSHMLFK